LLCGAADTFGPNARFPQTFGEHIQDLTIDGQTGHERERAPIFPALLMDCDQIQILSVENHSGELAFRQLGRPWRQSERCLAAAAGRHVTQRDRRTVEEGLDLAVKLQPREVETGSLGFAKRSKDGCLGLDFAGLARLHH
jgi:hypothetical protein